ncbi:translation factor (SUA5) [Candidatus Nanopelagicus abundans]|uniref:L-threonylcarbamoyladenylate synthase n=1 Tax=Candidatus Nanopelagicus abundans TaxID=1884916 RepID=A0A249L511_9ACTN|nr:Sua5/YciO/YrdC/YwlC family protein [Candidatus Nanopelagicus abundans]ASY24180.1 translation factor (SUA5) [Candidatus Nanopelagicus abundans]
MAERVLLDNLEDSKFNEAVDTAVRYIKSGEVIIAAAEHGYVYLADAFDKDAVKAIHILRGDRTNVVAQVFIGDIKVLTGITARLTQEQDNLLKAFWPGLLSVTMKSQLALSWDLGDERRLGKVNVRLPNRKFLNAILLKTGPLAAASVALTGESAILDLTQVSIYESDIGVIFDEGQLESGQLSTWIDLSENEITVIRVGDISLEQLRSIVPTISTPNL